MRVNIQWALDKAEPCFEIDASEWDNLEKLPDPYLTARVLGEKGWINVICVQGVLFRGYDHYFVEAINQNEDVPGCKVWMWTDDPVISPVGRRAAIVITFLPWAPDPKYGGRFNSNMKIDAYYDTDVYERNASIATENKTVHKWSEFILPDPAKTMHGITLADEEYQMHVDAYMQSERIAGRTWTEGIPAEAVEDGRIRKDVYCDSDGTIKLFKRS